MKNLWRKIIMCVLSVIVISCIGPTLIYVVYKTIGKSIWNAGDMLQYYASIVTGWVTIIIAVIALFQSYKSNELSKRLLEADQVSKKTFWALDEEKSFCFKQKNRDEITVTIFFRNISQIPISTFEITDGEENLYTDLEMALNSNRAGLVTDFDEVVAHTGSGILDCIEKHLKIEPPYGYDMPIFSFATETENIYGMKTRQIYNVVILNQEGKNKIMGYRTKGTE